MKPVTVSVVSHLQGELVAPLLGDLNRYCAAAIEKVVLTCNLPEALPVRSENFSFPVEFIHNQQPLGFGANHNQAFQRCESEWFLVLNPDIRLSRDVLGTLLQRATPDTGILAPQEVDERGAAVENVRGLITPWEVAARQLLKRPAPAPQRGGWVKGMFMLCRSDAFQAAGGFDTRYFMYCEDFDLCARLMLAGWSVERHSDVSVTHAWQRDSHGSRTHLKHHLQSLYRMWTSATFWRYRRLMARNS